MTAHEETPTEKLARLGEIVATVIEKSAPVTQLKVASEVVARLRPPDWSA